MPHGYATTTSQLSHVPTLRTLFRILPRLPYPNRKAILSCTRIQFVSSEQSRTYARLRDDLDSFHRDPVTGETIHLWSLIQSLAQYFESPVSSGLISMLCRNAPAPSIVEAQEVIEVTKEKEITAAVERYECAIFNWDAVLSHKTEERRRSLIPGAEGDFVTNTSIYSRMLEAKRDLSSRTFYPDYSRKTIGEDALQNIRDAYGEARYLGDSTLDLERLYHQENGRRVAGMTEMRYAWKYNDLKPRVYYARGPDQYYDSRYIQAIVMHILDRFPNVNRFERYHASSLHPDPGSTVFIYDYTSFTSKLQELHNFVAKLAEFFRGTRVYIVDSCQGKISQDLGDIFLWYNSTCNDYPSFDIARVCGLSSEDEIRAQIHTTGMLGVPGNISLCTLLHGIHLSCLLGGIDTNKVVGDDAIGYRHLISRYELALPLQNMGVINVERVEFWPPNDGEATGSEQWQYVKRPLDVYDHRIIAGSQLDWPPLGIMLDWSDATHTTRKIVDLPRHAVKVSNMLISFLLKAIAMSPTETEWALIRQFTNTVSRLARLEEWNEGRTVKILMPLDIEGRDIVSHIIQMSWDYIVKVPAEANVAYDPPEELRPNLEYEGRGSPILKLARDLGYVEVAQVFRHVLVRANPDAIRRSLQREIIPWFTFTIHPDTPTWIMSMLSEYYCESSAPDALDLETMYDLGDMDMTSDSD